jgi:hypothetical protein
MFAMLTLLACGIGIVLGLYFSVLILIPFSLLTVGASIFLSWYIGNGLSPSSNDMLFSLISGQAGYMLGLTAREAYARVLARFATTQSNRI